MLPGELQTHVLTRVLMKESQEEWFHCTTLDLPEAQLVAANTMSHVMVILDNHTLRAWAVGLLSFIKRHVIMVSTCSFICSTDFAAHLTCNCNCDACPEHSRCAVADACKQLQHTLSE